MRQHIVCGIDIGNYAIKTVIAELDRESLRPHIVGIGSALSNGLRRGVVTDMEELIHNVRESVSQAEAMASAKVERAYVAINGPHISSQLSRGVIIVSRADNEISQHDIERVVEAASTINLPPNRAIIHRIPKDFIIDGQEHVTNALGMRGVRLEADVLLIEGLTPYINNLARAVNANNIEVTEFVYSPLALSYSVLDKHQREHGVLSIDFGGGMSAMALFHEGELIHSAVLPVGARHITNDIAMAFRIDMDKAEIIKCEYAGVGLDDAKKDKDLVDLSHIVGEDDFVIPRKQIGRIVDARVSELFDMVSNELKTVSYKYVLPAGIVLSGGGANLRGLLSFAKNRLRLSGKIGGEHAFDGLPDRVTDPSCAVAIGLVLWGLDREGHQEHSIFSRFTQRFSQDSTKKLFKWFKNFLP